METINFLPVSNWSWEVIVGSDWLMKDDRTYKYMGTLSCFFHLISGQLQLWEDGTIVNIWIYELIVQSGVVPTLTSGLDSICLDTRETHERGTHPCKVTALLIMTGMSWTMYIFKLLFVWLFDFVPQLTMEIRHYFIDITNQRTKELNVRVK